MYCRAPPSGWRTNTPPSGSIASARAIRRCGAAALDLAYTAAGVYDGFFEFRLSPWDIAAGQIIVREAGGICSGITGNDDALKTGNVICGNEFIHAELVNILKPLAK